LDFIKSGVFDVIANRGSTGQWPNFTDTLTQYSIFRYCGNSSILSRRVQNSENPAVLQSFSQAIAHIK
jgi:hypothetical protein